MLKTSRKIFFSVVLISLLGSSSRCDAIFATLVVIAMKVAPYLIWTAPPVIIGGYQIYHNSLSDQMKRGFKKIGEKLQIIEVKVNANGIAIEVVKTRVESNGEAISELTKQENLHHQDGVRARAALQDGIDDNGRAIQIVQTSINDLSTTEAQHHTEHQQSFNQIVALIQANENVLTTLQQTTNGLTLIQRKTHIRLETFEEQLIRASQERASMTATLTDNSGQLSGLTEAQKQLRLRLQQQSQTQTQQSQTQTQQLTRMEAKIDRLLNQPSQLAHHSFLQRRQLLLWPSPRYALLFSATTAVPRAQVYALKQYAECPDE